MSAKCQKRTFSAPCVEQLQQSLYDCGATRGRHSHLSGPTGARGQETGPRTTWTRTAKVEPVRNGLLNLAREYAYHEILRHGQMQRPP